MIMSQKISTALGLIDRVYRLSDAQFIDNNKNLVMDLLKRNDFDTQLINRLMNRYYLRSNTSNGATTISQHTTMDVKRFSFPFVPRISK